MTKYVEQRFKDGKYPLIEENINAYKGYGRLEVQRMIIFYCLKSILTYKIKL